MLVQRALEVVAIGLALRGPFEIKQARIPGGNLYALVAKLGGPVGYESRVWNGARSLTNCARKIAGPLMVCMICAASQVIFGLRCTSVRAQSPAEPACAATSGSVFAVRYRPDAIGRPILAL